MTESVISPFEGLAFSCKGVRWTADGTALLEPDEPFEDYGILPVDAGGIQFRYLSREESPGEGAFAEFPLALLSDEELAELARAAAAVLTSDGEALTSYFIEALNL